MNTFLILTLIAGIGAAAYLYFKKKASLEVGVFPGILVGSSYASSTVVYEDDNGDEQSQDLHTLQFAVVFIMLTIVWKKK